MIQRKSFASNKSLTILVCDDYERAQKWINCSYINRPHIEGILNDDGTLWCPAASNFTKSTFKLNYCVKHFANQEDSAYLLELFPNIKSLRFGIDDCAQQTCPNVCRLLQNWAPKLVTLEYYADYLYENDDDRQVSNWIKSFKQKS